MDYTKSIPNVPAMLSRKKSSTLFVACGILFMIMLPLLHKSSPIYQSNLPSKGPGANPRHYGKFKKTEAEISIGPKVMDADYYPMDLASYLSDISYSQFHHENYTDLTCSDIRHHGIVHVTEKKELPLNIASIRDQLINSGFNDVVTSGDNTGLTDEEIVKKKWFRFVGGSVWLKEHNVHLLVSRVFYSREGSMIRAAANFMAVQIYDKDWKELIGHQLTIKNYETGEDQPMVFPTFFDFPFFYSLTYRYYGPEDPRIILRETHDGREEPIIIFNMYTQAYNIFKVEDFKLFRAIHILYPFANNKLLLLQIEGTVPEEKEKNWVPFFDKDSRSCQWSRGFIYFIYSFSPLEILECSLDYGICQRSFTGDSSFGDTGDMRGGTDLLPIPKEVPQPEGTQSWIGFARSHLDDCGCADRQYRPNLMILSKQGDEFYLQLISGSLDFNIDVLSWEGPGHPSCFGIRNVLIPNSLSYWDVVSRDSEGKYEDFLGLTLSEADQNVIIVHIRGLLNYIMDIQVAHNLAEIVSYTPSEMHYRTFKSVSCAVDDALKYCKAYGETHS
ncbi:unnamed protein product [Kuraishia capsulata CBS 1993]|uniref:Uncharacterized protein n=1 Tax=Kuraishia capsulata CBS 1993 TaxID=1382522 RepID=W6MNA9_9ASCO|nr:uncharacterized protein KUCA_T00004077001 [Kuraishia capsulata CBS 1993]CDK28096.1 unnamed protein product [Kuraishia capsulata CBS 1993]